MVAAVFVQPVLVVPIAALIAIGLAWYWARLGRPTVPRSRRRIRRWSLAMMFITLGLVVWALSFVDPRAQPQTAVTAWSLAVLALLAVMVTAGVDMVNNLRLHREAVSRDLHEAAVDLVTALRERRAAADRNDTAHDEDLASSRSDSESTS